MWFEACILYTLRPWHICIFFFSRSCGKSWGVFIPNKIFSLEKEKDSYLSLSGINIFWEKGNIVTNVYRKKNFSGVYTNFNSVIPRTRKTRLIKSLLFQYFKFWKDFMKFHQEIDVSKSITHKNSYLNALVDKHIYEFLNRVLTPNIIVSTVPKNDLMIVLPYWL